MRELKRTILMDNGFNEDHARSSQISCTPVSKNDALSALHRLLMVRLKVFNLDASRQPQYPPSHRRKALRWFGSQRQQGCLCLPYRPRSQLNRKGKEKRPLRAAIKTLSFFCAWPEVEKLSEGRTGPPLPCSQSCMGCALQAVTRGKV